MSWKLIIFNDDKEIKYEVSFEPFNDPPMDFNELKSNINNCLLDWSTLVDD